MHLNHEIRITGDGSKTLWLTDLKESYHSIHGAYAESQHVFIDNGLDRFKNDNIKILEIGYGTGLNCLLSGIYANSNKKNIEYTGIELYPLTEEINDLLKYDELIDKTHHKLYNMITDASWGEKLRVSDYYRIEKQHEDFITYTTKSCFNVVFFDAFAPEKQNELWTIEVFEKIYGFLEMGGLLTTYCAKGIIKRRLRSIGFEVESLPGPPGKREMTCAWKLK